MIVKEAEEQAIKRQNYRKGERTLDEYFEEWFEIFKKPTSKVTSIPTMKRSYKNYFGCYIGEMKMKDILSGDVQKVINLHHEDGKLIPQLGVRFHLFNSVLKEQNMMVLFLRILVMI